MWSFLPQLLGGLLGVGLSGLLNKNKGGQQMPSWQAPAEAWKPPPPPDLGKPETVKPVDEAYEDQKRKAAAALAANQSNPTGGLGLLGGATVKRKTLGVA